MPLHSIEDVIQGLKSAERMGAEKDRPEGFRYIQLSETLVLEMIEALERDKHAITLTR